MTTPESPQTWSSTPPSGAAPTMAVLQDLLDRLSTHLIHAPRSTLSTGNRWTESLDEHEALIQAIEQQDSDEAGKIARQHMETARTLRLQLLRETALQHPLTNQQFPPLVPRYRSRLAPCSDTVAFRRPGLAQRGRPRTQPAPPRDFTDRRIQFRHATALPCIPSQQATRKTGAGQSYRAGGRAAGMPPCLLPPAPGAKSRTPNQVGQGEELEQQTHAGWQVGAPAGRLCRLDGCLAGWMMPRQVSRARKRRVLGWCS